MNAQCNVADAIAMGCDMTRYFGRGIGREWRSEKKLHLSPSNQPGSSIPDPGFKSGVSDGNETESSPIKMRCLPSIGYVKLDVVDALEFERVRTHNIGGVVVGPGVSEQQ
jgi:hypothetical protein